MLSVNQIEDIKLQAYTCKRSVLNGVCYVYPLTMGEIFELGWNKHSYFLGTLLLTPERISSSIKEKTGEDIPPDKIDVLQYLLLSADKNDMFFLELQQMFSTFIKEDIILLPQINSVLVGSIEDKRLITSENFEDFQNILRLHHKQKIQEPPPENETAWERKMRINKQRVAEAKRRQAEKAGKGDSDIQTMLEIAQVYGIDYKNESYYAFYSLLPRYQLHEKWETDMQMICAGADSKKMKTQYWGESSKED